MNIVKIHSNNTSGWTTIDIYKAVNKYFKTDEIKSTLQNKLVGVVVSEGASIPEGLSAFTDIDVTRETKQLITLTSNNIGYSICRFISSYADIKDMVVVNTACASSLYSFFVAEKMLAYCDVIVIVSTNIVSKVTQEIFRQSNIDIPLTGSFNVCTVDNTTNSNIKIEPVKTYFKVEKNPFATSYEGYLKVLPYNIHSYNYIIPHGTPTPDNIKAEQFLQGYGIPVIAYKNKLGHSQGSATIFELNHIINSTSLSGNILMLASGVGGHYGSIKVSIKR